MIGQPYFRPGAEPHIINLCFKGFQRGEFPMKTVTITTKDAFEKEKRPAFSPFASVCVKRQILSAVKSYGRQKHALLNNCLSGYSGRG